MNNSLVERDILLLRNTDHLTSYNALFISPFTNNLELNMQNIGGQPVEQSEQSNFSYCSISELLIYFILASFIFFWFRVKRQRKKIIRQPNFNQIEESKIIVAIQIKDFFIQYSDKITKKGFISLNIRSKSWAKGLADKIFNKGNYYKPIFPPSKIRIFLEELRRVDRVQLMLYTCLKADIADTILQRLRISDYFPIKMRRFCNLNNKDDQKHAIEVDKQTRRVIIVTPNKKDHRPEHDKYFLVIKPCPQQANFLKSRASQIKEFITTTQNISELHDKLAEININYDTESSVELV